MVDSTGKSEKSGREPLGGIDPQKLLARILHSAPPVEKNGRWTPLSPEELEFILTGYTVDSLIGRGGMGAVYLVCHKDLHRVSALKLLPLCVSERPDFEERFLREARAMASLQHPNIVHLYDFGRTSEGHLYYVMEYVEGADLAQLIKDGGVSGQEALHIISQVSDALEYAHKNGYVHRDIKPANVLINTEGVVKVVDFGLAKIIHDQEYDPTMTIDGEVMGTPGYMSPEQTLGVEVDHRSDIYALGVMLYELLTGTLPQGNFELPSKRRGGSQHMDKVVMKALSQRPEQRFQSAGDIKMAIVKCDRGWRGRSARLKGDILHPYTLWSVCVVCVLLAAVVFFMTGSTGYKNEIQPTANREFQNSLAMRLLPVRGTKVLFSEAETRWREWDTFIEDADYQWTRLSFNEPADHAAVQISWNDAQEFCEWLTAKEQEEGRIGPAMRYRLPTDKEWSFAVGLAGEAGSTPQWRSEQGNGRYYWGKGWPVPQESIKEFDDILSDAFEIIEVLRDSVALLGGEMQLERMQEYKNMTYRIAAKPWAVRVPHDFVYASEKAARIMQTATDQVQVRHWNGKTVVVMGRWMAKHAETALPLVGWQTPDWNDEGFRRFFENEDWGHKSGLSLFAPAHWDDVKGAWMLGEKPIPTALFASKRDAKRSQFLKIDLEDGRLVFRHDRRDQVCYPVVLFDGELNAAEIRQQVQAAYDTLQGVWYEKSAHVCRYLLTEYQEEWKRRSQNVQLLSQNEFGLLGVSGGVKEWVMDAYDTERAEVKTLRGGAIRLRGRGLPYIDSTLSDEELVKAQINYAVSPRDELLITYRDRAKADARQSWCGFRVVLDLGEGE